MSQRGVLHNLPLLALKLTLYVVEFLALSLLLVLERALHVAHLGQSVSVLDEDSVVFFDQEFQLFVPLLQQRLHLHNLLG